MTSTAPLERLAVAALAAHELALKENDASLARTAEGLLRRIAAVATVLPAQSGEVGAVVKEQPEDRYLLCVAYSASRMPARGADHHVDLASPDVLERACWKFALNGYRVGVDHKPGGGDAAQVVENFVHRGEPWVVKGPDGSSQTVYPGDWCIGLILAPEAWADYKAGRFGGISVQGTAGRKPATTDTLARMKE